MSTPSVSVMMPVYNGARHVRRAVESILGQSFADFELLILDDGSTDATRDILGHLAGRDGRIRLISRPHRGLIASRNELLEAARAEFVACMDADDVSLPGRLAAEVDHLRAHPDCVLVGTPAIIIDPAGRALTVRGRHLDHESIGRALMRPTEQAIYHSSVMFRRSAALRAGGYRAGTDPAEDFDLFLRLAEVGRLANLGRPLLEYREHLAKEGHVHRDRQSAAVLKGLEDAYRRRGLEAPAWLADFRLLEVHAIDRRRAWAWWALEAGNIAAARIHAWSSVVRAPISVASWRLLYCAMRGR